MVVRCIFILTLAALVTASPQQGPRTDGDPWSCQAFTFQGDVWLRSYLNGAGLFDFQVGGGGAIVQMRYCADQFQALLSPACNNPSTDRVFQTVWWDGSVRYPAAPPPDDPRYNVNQAGTDAGEYTPSIAASMTNDISKNECSVTVVSRPQDQWNAACESVMLGNYTMQTTYTLRRGGVLHVARSMLVGDVFLNGQRVPLAASYVEAWSPFNVPVFNAMALAVDAAGQPQWWYSTSNLPDYPAFPVNTTYGYAIVYNSDTMTTTPAVALVFGTQPLQRCYDNAPCQAGGGAQGVDSGYALNSMAWNDGIGVLPGMYFPPLETGDFIHQELVLIPQPSLSPSLVAAVNEQVAALRPPALYRRSTAMPSDLMSIRHRLASSAVETGLGNRTGHLASLL